MLRKIKILIAVLTISAYSLAEAETFTISNIKVNGLKRITRGAVLSNLPVKVGDKMDSAQSSEIIRRLYETNFFSNIDINRSGNALIIDVVERAVIGSLKISGNSKITKQQLTDALKNVGIAEGQELDPAVLNSIKNAIINQYYSMGMYNPKVNINVKNEDRNRVALAINISEGPASKIKSIKIVGNRAFSQRALLKDFSLTTTKLWSFLTHSDQYSKEKLDADLEKLRAYYMDRGCLKISINSTKVSITQDKKGIYITINITEGPIYKFDQIVIDGDLIGKRKEILQLIEIKSGEVFSRKRVIELQSKISLFLGDYGYAMAEISPDYKIDDNARKVWMKFTVTPGHRVYVRHINFTGNYRSNDEVLRREMRLQEGGLFSLSKINESSRRLANLGYLQDINHNLIPVANTNNQADLNYSVKEVSSTSLNLQAGFSDRDGFLYGASISDQNVFGTGKAASIQFDNSRATQSYGFSYHDPYFTVDKIGLSVNGYVYKTNPSKISGELTSYRSSTYGLITTLDAPLSDYTQVSFGMGVEHIGLGNPINPSSKIEDFINRYGSSFNQIKLIGNISYSNLDRSIFPTSGFAQSLSVDGYAPLNSRSLEFYKADYNAVYYQPLGKNFIFRLGGELGYGDGIGKTKVLPPFKNFYAGGMSTVRGFDDDTISSYQDKDRVVGGNLLTVGSASIIIPSPMPDMVRLSTFIDVGSVWDTHTDHFKFGDLRYSAGFQVEWRTPLAPLRFSFAKPIHKKDWDSTQLFQFSISTSI